MPKNISSPEEYERAAELIVSSGAGTSLTGAGISVDSGIPPFTGTSGLWEKYDPEEYVTITGFARNPAKVWKLYKELGHMLEDAEPNEGHITLATLEKAGYINGVITQNIDALHQKAGSEKVIEYHGGGNRAVCMKCRKQFPLDEKLLEKDPPECPDCKVVLKPDIVFYGEPIPRYAALESMAMVQDAGFILVVGTASIVYPANQLPLAIKGKGGAIIEFNVERTPLTEIADVTLYGSSSETLPRLLEELKRKEQ